MNDMLGSECSSGCESGWTLYLEHSFLSHRNNEFVDGRAICEEDKKAPKVEDNGEEDLSMISDASSGPPNFHEDDYYCNASNGFSYYGPMDSTLPRNSGKRKKKGGENRRRKVEEHPSFLDDTASSPIFNFSQSDFNNQASMENILDFPQGCSATHLEGRSAFDEPFGFFQTSSRFLQGRSAFDEPFGFFQTSISGNQLQRNQWFGGKTGMR